LEELQMDQGSRYRKYSREFRESALRRLSSTADVSHRPRNSPYARARDRIR